jgi:hypothetical protein
VQIELSYGPATVAFDPRDVNTGASPERTATITNTGGEPVTLTGLTLSGDATDFIRVTGASADCSAVNRLEAAESCTVRLRFDPSATGARAAVLTVTSNALPIAIPLTGSGTLTQLSRDPGLLEFGWHDLDAGPAEQTARIANTGTEPVALTDFTLSGDSAHFKRLTGAADCTTATLLEIGAECRVRLRFDPTTTGLKTATLTVASNAPSITLDLTGTGTTTLPDYDGDGLPDDRDTDDDNDGVPDDRDPFPLDSTRQAWPVEPAPVPPAPAPAPAPAPVQPAQAPARPWRLKRVARVLLASRGGVVRVATGYVAICPAGGPECTGRLTLKLRRRSSRSRKVISIFLTPKSRPVTIEPGTSWPIRFRLSARGRALLTRHGSLKAVLRGALHTEGQRAVVRRARLRLAARTP